MSSVLLGCLRSSTITHTRSLQWLATRRLLATHKTEVVLEEREATSKDITGNFEVPEASEPGAESPALTDSGRRQSTSAAAWFAQAKKHNEPHFRLGHKKIWLPDFEVTFIRTPKLDPRFAKFRVPLHIGKLDFRDFLWHGYQTRALNIRSWVFQRPVELHERDVFGKTRLRWHRKEAIKYMLVEMDEPFIWPEKSEDDQGMDPELFHDLYTSALAKDGKSGRERWLQGTSELDEPRQKLREKAEDILSGKVKWRPTHEVYQRPRYS